MHTFSDAGCKWYNYFNHIQQNECKARGRPGQELTKGAVNMEDNYKHSCFYCQRLAFEGYIKSYGFTFPITLQREGERERAREREREREGGKKRER